MVDKGTKLKKINKIKWYSKTEDSATIAVLFMTLKERKRKIRIINGTCFLFRITVLEIPLIKYFDPNSFTN